MYQKKLPNVLDGAFRKNNAWKLLTILAKNFILDVWQGSEYVPYAWKNELISGICYSNLLNY